MKTEKMEIKLAEVTCGYQEQGTALITIEEGVVVVYKILERFTYCDRMELKRNFQVAINSLKKRKKIRESGPLNIVNGEMYIDDMLILRIGEESVSVSIVI